MLAGMYVAEYSEVGKLAVRNLCRCNLWRAGSAKENIEVIWFSLMLVSQISLGLLLNLNLCCKLKITKKMNFLASIVFGKIHDKSDFLIVHSVNRRKRLLMLTSWVSFLSWGFPLIEEHLKSIDSLFSRVKDKSYAFRKFSKDCRFL